MTRYRYPRRWWALVPWRPVVKGWRSQWYADGSVEYSFRIVWAGHAIEGSFLRPWDRGDR